jgi:ubiquinone/menaquinone biosynthesis C-methylase UbiE
MEMHKNAIRDHFDRISSEYDQWKAKSAYYHESLKNFFRHLVRPDDDVIEFGCGTGDVLASVGGRRKVGLDISEQMVRRAAEKHPDIRFLCRDAEQPYEEESAFDVAILADIMDHVTDILNLYATVNRSLRIGGRMCISTINPLWNPIFALAEKLGKKMPEGEHNFVPNRDLINFLRLRGFRFVAIGAHMLIPRRIPWISDAINRIAPRLPVVWRLCVAQTLVAEKVSEYREEFATETSCSVVIPCFNEADNIRSCVSRVPSMGKWTEIIVVDDGSTDGTADAARRFAAEDARVKVVAYTPNRGKGYAVKQGLDSARGDILMILDADMTVMPEELPVFFRPLVEGLAEFANGTRMVYPMEDQAMRALNLIGNFFFGAVMSWLLSQRVSDTLCGTKAFRRSDYPRIPMGGDRWGDFDLLFGAVENRLRIVEIPVHYKARTQGVSKMRPFKHSLVLLKMCWIGFLRTKLGIRPRTP